MRRILGELVLLSEGAFVLVFLLPPALAVTQEPAPVQPRWAQDISVAAGNALVGAATGGVLAWTRGTDVADGFLRGAAGGALVFAGKRIAVEPFRGSGLLGRQMSAVGTSIVANSGLGVGFFQEIWLPVGPVWLRVNGSEPIGIRLSLRDLVVAAWAALQPELEFDAEASLTNGSLVFQAPRHRLKLNGDPVGGTTAAGIVLLGASAPNWVRGHEMVHVLQDDFLMRSWSQSAEGWLWRRVLDRSVAVDLGLVSLFLLPTPFRLFLEAEAEVLDLR